jgi:hypothetical protein
MIVQKAAVTGQACPFTFGLAVTSSVTSAGDLCFAATDQGGSISGKWVSAATYSLTLSAAQTYYVNAFGQFTGGACTLCYLTPNGSNRGTQIIIERV